MNKVEHGRSYFVTGTDTDCGKTLVSAALMRNAAQQGLSTAAVKPVAAGAELRSGHRRNEDGLILQAECTLSLSYEQVNPVCLQAAIAPHIAAQYENTCLSADTLHSACSSVIELGAQFTIIEGAGGWLVPLNTTETLADLAAALAASHNTQIILVVRIQLGCISHALLTAAAILGSDLTLAGWVANCVTPYEEQENNIQAIAQRIDAPCLGIVPHLPGADAAKTATHIRLPGTP